MIASGDELLAWLAEAQGAPVAVAISKSAEGEFALDTIGLAWRAGEARAVHAEHFAALQPWLEDAAAVKIACDVKAALLELARLGIAGARLRSRRDAVRLPAGCRPLGLRAWKSRRAAAWI